MKTQLRVAHVITGLGLGGAERMLYKQLGAIDRQRFLSMVVSLGDRGGLGDSIAELGVPVHALNMKRGAPNPFALLKLAQLLRDFEPDLVQTWMPHADLLGTVASKLARVPHLSWNIRCSNVDYASYGASTRWSIAILTRLSRVPDLVVANSFAGRTAHEKLGFAPRRWRVIPNGFNLEQLKPDPSRRAPLRAALGVSPDAFLIAMVARFDVMKDHATALAALRQVPDVHLVAIGKGMTRENPALVAPDLAGRLHLLGERRDVTDTVAGCDIATLSSLGEGFPNVLGEAMACGLPCVTTDVGDAALIVGDTGITVPPRDPERLARGWRELYAMPAGELQSLGARARQRIAEHWSLETVVKAYEDTYLELVRG